MSTSEDFKKAFDDFRAQFKQANSTVSSNPSDLVNLVSNNTIAVNKLLDALYGVKEADRQRTAQQQQSAKPELLPKEVLPTYNTRTPYVELSINGLQVIPMVAFDQNAAALQSFQSEIGGVSVGGIDSSILDVNFVDASLEMPFGGVAPTISGSVRIYTRTPLELLSFIVDDLATDATGAGLPIIELKIGWKVAKGDGEVLDILSPLMQFLVLNIEMNDAGLGQGVEFIFKIQDAGSAVLRHSSSDFAFPQNYPQEQLRGLLEGILGLRLFTLDDLLYLNQSENLQDKKTFFLTEPVAPFRINNNTVEIAIKDILSKIKCRWFPVSNKDLPVAIKDSIKAIEDVKNISEAKVFADTAAQKKQLAQENIRLSSACSLFWVPYFPADIQTSSGTTYLNQPSDFKESGAYVLLPNPVADINLKQNELPIIYGPGGSSSPYFYGGAQNILQSAIDSQKLKPGTYGDVLSLNINYSSLLALMKASVNESLTYVETVQRMGSQKTTGLSISAAEKKALLQITKDKIIGNSTTQSILAAAQQKKTMYRANRFRFQQTFAPRTLVFGDKITDLDKLKTKPNSRTFGNSLSMDKEASLRLKQRIGAFINFPISIGMSVLGDPFLLRQGLGVFELINYFPTMDMKTLQFNYLASGVYMPTKISHRITMSDYITDIQAYKVPEIESSVKDTYKQFIQSELDKNNLNVLQVDLESPDPNANPFVQASKDLSNQTNQTVSSNVLAVLLQNIKKQQSN